MVSFIRGTLVFALLIGCAAESEQPWDAKNPRNILLSRIQGKSHSDQVTTVCDIARYDPDRELRSDAIRYLGALGSEASSASQTLIDELISQPDMAIVYALQHTLSQLGPAIVPDLMNSVKSSHKEGTIRLITVIGALGAAATEAIPWLSLQIDGSNFELRQAAIIALGKIGPTAKPVLPQLVTIISEPRVPLNGDSLQAHYYRQSRDLQAAAVRAVSLIGADLTALPALRLALKEEPLIAESAANAIAQLGPSAAMAAADLRLLSQRNDHRGKDIKTRAARLAAENALASVEVGK